MKKVDDVQEDEACEKETMTTNGLGGFAHFASGDVRATVEGCAIAPAKKRKDWKRNFENEHRSVIAPNSRFHTFPICEIRATT